MWFWLIDLFWDFCYQIRICLEARFVHQKGLIWWCSQLVILPLLFPSPKKWKGLEVMVKHASDWIISTVAVNQGEKKKRRFLERWSSVRACLIACILHALSQLIWEIWNVVRKATQTTSEVSALRTCPKINWSSYIWVGVQFTSSLCKYLINCKYCKLLAELLHS